MLDVPTCGRSPNDDEIAAQREPFCDERPAGHSPAPIDRAHREDLETLRALLRTAVALESRCDFGEPPTAGRPNRRAFLTHFPELRGPLERWEKAVELARSGSGELWSWLESATFQRHLEEPYFAVGGVIDTLAMLTRERARNWQLHTPYQLSFEHFAGRLTGEPAVIYLEGQRVAQLHASQAEELRERVGEACDALQQLFDDAQQTNAARGLTAAYEEMLTLQEELAGRLVVIEPRSAPNCAACGRTT